jgi:hypothetical protein
MTASKILGELCRLLTLIFALSMAGGGGYSLYWVKELYGVQSPTLVELQFTIWAISSANMLAIGASLLVMLGLWHNLKPKPPNRDTPTH